MSLGRDFQRMLLGAGGLIWLSLWVLACGFQPAAVAQSHQPLVGQGRETRTLDLRGTGASADERASDRQSDGSVGGIVMDQDGAVVVGAQVRITHADQSSPKQEVVSGDNGQFLFANVRPGPFQLTIASAGFETQAFSGTLRPGEHYTAPEIVLTVAPAITEVQVRLTPVEVAQEQIEEQEKQRVLGFIPNFFVSYVPDAVPLTPKQKFRLAWKSGVDPGTFVAVGALAGFQQAADDFGGYGQGAQGYAKRFGAAYADVFVGTFIGSAILPSLLKQDPRYFYKGAGSIRSRTLYAVGNALICKGDNKKWQPNYSVILGSFATGGISYLYYPASDRKPGLMVQNSLIRIAGIGLAGVFQEFIIRKLTPHKSPPAQP